MIVLKEWMAPGCLFVNLGSFSVSEPRFSQETGYTLEALSLRHMNEFQEDESAMVESQNAENNSEAVQPISRTLFLTGMLDSSKVKCVDKTTLFCRNGKLKSSRAPLKSKAQGTSVAHGVFSSRQGTE